MREAGFTLVEMIVTVAVLAILATLAVPGLQDLLGNARRAAAVNGFIGAVQLARSESIKRARPVSLCRSEDGASCAGPGDWARGWLVFVPADPGRPALAGPGSDILRFEQSRYRGAIEANRAVFVFRPGDARSTNGTVIFCDPRGPAASRAVIISHTGRPRGSAYSATGTALPC